MTNEQLASFIKQGGNDELIPLLWERVRKLVNLLANRYFKAYADKLTAYGITVEDIRQTGYFAFTQAVNSFDESKKYKFSSYLRYPFKNEIRRILTKDGLNGADSLNEPISRDGKDSADDQIEKIEFLLDESSLDFVEQVDRDSLCGAVRSAISKLDPEYRDYIHKRFYDGRTFKQLAAEKGISTQAAHQYEKNLLAKLRKNEDFIKINAEFCLSAHSSAEYGNTYTLYKRTGMTAFEREIISAADRIAEYRNFVQHSQEEREQLAKKYGLEL